MSTTTTTRPASAAASTAMSAGAALIAGLFVGALTNVLQGVLPDGLQALSNSGSVWSAAAFAAGAMAILPRVAVLAGTVTEVGAVVGYYAYAELVRDGMGDLAYPLFWLAIALVAGPLFGTAGAWWRTGIGWRRVAGPALLGAVFGMDALWYQFALGYHGNAIGYGVVGLLVPVLLGSTTRLRLIGVAAAAVLSVVAVGALWVVTGLPVLVAVMTR
ncbi:DUF6518 family protein [Umezawaea sp. Da 62-37]|uniref:DUF6518 family protein n=1 Tax=Umezawaea sp. Da 62-37 TaxID=3075927 RepID=UPI0028F7135F|nr:DUF6518 family protein [Umezawaea sp. Da 62-37]WNV86306.1 DUF6518 family protein [Umezawaea sp. Da 62-37]